jgi:hypothetical protein
LPSDSLAVMFANRRLEPSVEVSVIACAMR